MIQVQRPSGHPETSTRGRAVHRDLLVGRYDHVSQGATWLQDLAAEAARVADVPAAAINLMKSTTQRTVAAMGVDTGIHAREDSMCTAIIDERRAVHVPDASADERWVDHPFVDGRRGRIRFYGSHPLIGPSGLVVGTLCVFDVRARELEPARVAQLETLAVRIVEALEASRRAALAAGVRLWSTTVELPAPASAG